MILILVHSIIGDLVIIFLSPVNVDFLKCIYS